MKNDWDWVDYPETYAKLITQHGWANTNRPTPEGGVYLRYLKINGAYASIYYVRNTGHVVATASFTTTPKPGVSARIMVVDNGFTLTLSPGSVRVYPTLADLRDDMWDLFNNSVTLYKSWFSWEDMIEKEGNELDAEELTLVASALNKELSEDKAA